MHRRLLLPRGSRLQRVGARESNAAGWALALGSFVYLLCWPPTLNPGDESYILYEAKRVLQGEAPYRDFFDFLTPGSYYFYALAYALGGTSITSARVATALLDALSVGAVYFLALRVASMAEAAVAALLVVVACVPVWNMASHHWIATAFGLATAAVLLAERWQASARLRPAAAGALAALVLCTHQGRGGWLAVWLGIATLLLGLGRVDARRWRRCARELGWTAVGGAAVCFPILGYALWHSSLAEMWDATYTFVTTDYRHGNFVGSYGFGGVRWAASDVFTATVTPYTYLWLLKSIPLLIAVEIVTLLWATWRSGLRSQLVRAILLLLAVTAIGSLAYYPDVVHVALGMPFALPVFAGMAYRLRTARVLSRTRAARAIGLAVYAAALILVLAKGFTNQRLAWSANPVLFRTAFGTLAGPEGSFHVLRDLRRELHPDAAAPPHLLAYPNQAWIYLALPAENPTPFNLLQPRYSAPKHFVTAFEHVDRDPRALVLVNFLLLKPTDPIHAYLRNRFHEVAQLGTFFRLYARNPPAAAAPDEPSAPARPHAERAAPPPPSAASPGR